MGFLCADGLKDQAEINQDNSNLDALTAGRCLDAVFEFH